MGLLDWLSDLLKKIISFVKKFWPIILIAVLLFVPGAQAFLASAWSWLGGLVAEYGLVNVLMGAFGVLAIVSPDTASEIVGNVAEVAGSIGEAAGGVLGSTVSGFLSSPGGLLILGAAGLFILPKLLSPNGDARPVLLENAREAGDASDADLDLSENPYGGAA